MIEENTKIVVGEHVLTSIQWMKAWKGKKLVWLWHTDATIFRGAREPTFMNAPPESVCGIQCFNGTVWQGVGNTIFRKQTVNNSSYKLAQTRKIMFFTKTLHGIKEFNFSRWDLPRLRDRICVFFYYLLFTRLCHDLIDCRAYSMSCFSHNSPFSSHWNDIRPRLCLW